MPRWIETHKTDKEMRRQQETQRTGNETVKWREILKIGKETPKYQGNHNHLKRPHKETRTPGSITNRSDKSSRYTFKTDLVINKVVRTLRYFKLLFQSNPHDQSGYRET